jgi:hypothetical protein
VFKLLVGAFDMSAPVCLQLDGGAGPRFSPAAVGAFSAFISWQNESPFLIFSANCFWRPPCSRNAARRRCAPTDLVLVDQVIKKLLIGNDPLQSALPPG